MDRTWAIISVLIFSTIFTSIGLWPCYDLIGFYGIVLYNFMSINILIILIAMVHATTKFINQEHLD